MPYWGYGGFDFFLNTLQKLLMCNLIASIFGTNEERVTVNSHSKFAVNLKNIQGVMSVYSHRKKSNFCYGYRVTKYRNNFKIGVYIG